MGKIFALVVSTALSIGYSATASVAETGKCIVTDVAGNKMVIQCSQVSKEFDKGAKIKIKTEKKKAEDGR